MPFISFVLAALIALSGSVTASIYKGHTQAREVSSQVTGAALRVTVNGVAAFMKDNPTHSGSISLNTLYNDEYLPNWFNADDRLFITAKDGRAYIYIAKQAGNYVSLDSIITKNDVPASVGISRSGKLISPNSGTVLFELPDSIPNNTVVYVI